MLGAQAKGCWAWSAMPRNYKQTLMYYDYQLSKAGRKFGHQVLT